MIGKKRENIVASLDIGTTKVVAMIATQEEPDQLKLIGLGEVESKGMKRGVVMNIQEMVDSITEAVLKAETEAGNSISKVYAGIAGDHIESINSRGAVVLPKPHSEITQGDVDKVIENAKAIAIPQNRQILHVIPQEYIVDDQHGVQQPVGLSGLRLEVKVHIVTASVSMIKNLLNCINKAKLEVIGLALEPLVSSQSVLNKGDEDLGIIIIDMGGGTTDLAIYYDGSVRHTAVIGYGGENITNDLAVGIGTSKQEAERIKKEYGCSFRSIIDTKENIMINDFTPGNSREISLQVLNSIIEPRAEEILEFAYREYKKTDFHGLIAGGVILTGGGALLKGIENLTKQIFDMPVRIGNPHGIQGLENKISHPKFATGVGLLVNGYKTNGAFSNKEKYGAMEKVWQPIRNFFKDII